MRVAKLVFFLFIVSTAPALASGQLDQELAAFINQFRIKPLKAPKAVKPELYRLGKSLFSEKALSGNKNISCASCHSPSMGTADGLPLGIGEGANFNHSPINQAQGLILKRNTPGLFNIGHESLKSMFWDRRVMKDHRGGFQSPWKEISGQNPQLSHISSLFTHVGEVQALFPILSPEEMLGMPGENEIASLPSNELIAEKLTERILNITRYKELFKKAFPQTPIEKINIGHIAKAIFAFEKKEFSVTNTPWDQYLRGDTEAISVSEKKGAKIFFNKGLCIRCHFTSTFGGLGAANVAVPQVSTSASAIDKGQCFGTSGEHCYRFKVPMLRNVKLTAPYMHNGAYQTLKEVIDHYNDTSYSLNSFDITKLNQKYQDSYKDRIFTHDDPQIHEETWKQSHPLAKTKLNLTEEEKKDLLAFLEESLTQK
ncbi:MAG: cytochrome-c peroxidase [Bacteriovoracaceae bacterium]